MKKSLKVCAFLLGFVILFNYFNKLLLVKLLDQPWDNYYKVTGFYQEPEDSIDVLFMGSSVMFCGVNPMTIWDEYGVTSYVFANGAQSIQLSYYYLQEALKRQSPSVVVLDVSTFHETLERTPTNGVLVWNLETMPVSLEKLELINAYVEPSDKFSAFFNIVNYHARWKELGEQDYKVTHEQMERNVSKGGSYAFVEGGGNLWTEISGRELASLDYHMRDGSAMNETTKEWLIKYIEYAKERGVDVILVKNPQIGDYSQDYADSVAAVAEQYGVEFWNNADPTEFGLDLNRCYMDAAHTNYWGNTQYSKIIGQKLSEKYGLENKKTNNEYAYWNEDYTKYKELITKAQEDYEQLIQGGLQ